MQWLLPYSTQIDDCDGKWSRLDVSLLISTMQWALRLPLLNSCRNILPIEDEDVSKEVAKSFKKSGIEIMTDASVESVDTKGAGCKVRSKN